MTEWLLLKFSDNFADEFDVDAIVVTTRDRWERAKAALHAAYPDGASFEASFGKLVRLTWRFIIEHGVLPSVPDGPIEKWLHMLAFHAPPARCAAHGNVIGQCDRGRDGVPAWAPACQREDIEIAHVQDPDYDALMLPEGA